MGSTGSHFTDLSLVVQRNSRDLRRCSQDVSLCGNSNDCGIDPPMNMQVLQKLRELTGWGLRAAQDLLNACNDDQTQAQALYTYRKKQVDDAIQALNRVKRAPARGGWWIDEFVGRSPPVASLRTNDTVLEKWANIHGEYNRYLNELTSLTPASLSELNEAVNRLPNSGHEEQFFQALSWSYACRTHLIPRFEPGWLESLVKDPCERIRPLQRPGIAEIELRRQATYTVPNSDTRAIYLAEALRQAEQYLIAAQNVELSVRPLLLYYASTCFARAMLTPRFEDLQQKYGAHGLKGESTISVRSLSDYSVHITATQGLVHGLLDGLRGGQFDPRDGPWSLLELCAYVPELSEVIEAYSPIKSRASRILRFEEYHPHGVKLPGIRHLGFVLTFEYLKRCGLDPAAANIHEKLREAFPHAFWALGRDIDFHGSGSPIERCASKKLDDHIIAYVHLANSADEQQRIYPLLHQGALDGEFYTVYAGKHAPPHPFIVLHTLLYGLSMLVRYKPVSWKEMLDAPDMSRALIEQLSRIALVKLPILATEELLSRRILGSLRAIPH